MKFLIIIIIIKRSPKTKNQSPKFLGLSLSTTSLVCSLCSDGSWWCLYLGDWGCYPSVAREILESLPDAVITGLKNFKCKMTLTDGVNCKLTISAQKLAVAKCSSGHSILKIIYRCAKCKHFCEKTSWLKINYCWAVHRWQLVLLDLVTVITK